MNGPDIAALAPQPRWLKPGRVFLIFNLLVTIGLLASFVSISPGGLLGLLELQISRNSEAFALCLLVSLDLQFALYAGRSRRWTWWAFLVFAFLVTELVGNLPVTVVTLSESFLGALLISVFLTLFQPNHPRWHWRWAVPLIGFCVVLVGELPFTAFQEMSPWIMLKAETWGFLSLTAILVGYLSSYPWKEVRPSTSSRVLWILTITLLPLVVASINPNGVDSVAAVGPLESLMVWIQRITESFIAAVLLTVLCWLLEPRGGSAENEATETP
jgi:hypothetical protein